MNLSNVFFRISAVLWFIWGSVHILAGVMTTSFILSGDITGAVSGIADAVDPDSLQANYPMAAGAIIGQHGFNLLWIGVITLVCSFLVWKGKKNAVYLAAITGGLADLGYFLFMDIGGYTNFVSGTIMTLVSGGAIILSFWALSKRGAEEANA